jgi:hypothetical protein
MEHKLKELKTELYAFAKKYTQSPTTEGLGFRSVTSTPDSGLKVTTRISIEKFRPYCSEKELNDVVAEMEKDFAPDLGVWCDEQHVWLSRFISGGGPWVEEWSPGVTVVFEVGKRIVAHIDRDVQERSQDMHRQHREAQRGKGDNGCNSAPP